MLLLLLTRLRLPKKRERDEDEDSWGEECIEEEDGGGSRIKVQE